MPHTKSAKKNLRKAEKRRIHNRTIKKVIKTYLKRFEAALDGPIEALQVEFNLVSTKLDKAAIKRIIHPNQAARKKSQLARAVNAKKAAAAAPKA